MLSALTMGRPRRGRGRGDGRCSYPSRWHRRAARVVLSWKSLFEGDEFAVLKSAGSPAAVARDALEEARSTSAALISRGGGGHGLGQGA